MTAAVGPYVWEPHPGAWIVLVAAVVAVVVGHRRARRSTPGTAPWPRRQIVTFTGAVLAAAVALTWPLADLAAHWSLTVLVVQRLLLVLAVPPLVLLGLPYDRLQRVTRPGPVDAVIERCRRPAVAVPVFMVVAVGSMLTPVVEAQASSAVVRALVDLAVLAAGFVLWIPVIGRVPGIARLRPVGRFSYLVIQSVLPAFLSFVYIFARRPLYTTFAGSHRAVGMRPLNDQQIAGFVSKLGMLFVLLTVGAVVLTRAQRLDERSAEAEAAEDPLLWGDVERQFERADRRSGRSGWSPPDGTGGGETGGAQRPVGTVPETAPGAGGRAGARPDATGGNTGGDIDCDKPDPAP